MPSNQRASTNAGLAAAPSLDKPRPVSTEDLGLMRRLDELHLDFPFAGARMLRDLLKREGASIGRRHVATLMKRMGIEAIYRRPNMSKPAPGQDRSVSSARCDDRAAKPGSGDGHQCAAAAAAAPSSRSSAPSSGGRRRSCSWDRSWSSSRSVFRSRCRRKPCSACSRPRPASSTSSRAWRSAGAAADHHPAGRRRRGPARAGPGARVRRHHDRPDRRAASAPRRGGRARAGPRVRGGDRARPPVPRTTGPDGDRHARGRAVLARLVPMAPQAPAATPRSGSSPASRALR